MTSEVITEAEALAEIERLRRERDKAMTETAWERYVRERPEFHARLSRYLNKIPQMVEEMEAVSAAGLSFNGDTKTI